MKISIKKLLITLIIFSTLPQPLAAGDCGKDHEAMAGTKAPMPVTEAEIEGIYNYSRIEGKAGFGGATEASAMNALKDEGYGTVINLRLADEDGVDVPAARMAASQAGLKYVHLPFDTSNPDPDFLDRFLAELDAESNQPVYIHCGSATRVAALWMTKRVLDDGVSSETAETEARVIAGKPDAAVAFAEKYIEANQ